MLSELEDRHATLGELMTRMQQLVAMRAPALEEVNATRLSLSKASTARTRHLTDAVYPWLLARVDQARAREVSLLRESGAPERARSSNHIARWSGAAVAADWTGYQRAANQILAMMAARIEQEKALLYPLLRDHQQNVRTVLSATAARR